MMANCFDSRIVIDNGSCTIKAGYSGDDLPKIEIPSVIGITESFDNISEKKIENFHIGSETLFLGESDKIVSPFEKGIIQGWDEMKTIWHHLFSKELKANPAEFPILITEPPLNPKDARERMAEIFFEEFSIPAFYVVNQAVLSLYSCGRTTGLVVHCGNQATHAVPIYDGYTLSNVAHIDIGGLDLTKLLSRFLRERIPPWMNNKAVLRKIKEKLCYVSLDLQSESEVSINLAEVSPDYIMPDGSQINLGRERYMIPEVLFKPFLVDSSNLFGGIDEVTNSSIMNSDSDIREDLWKNIITSGCTSLFSGFDDRLSKELKAKAPPNVRVQLLFRRESRPHNPWIGGSIFASLSSMNQFWVTRDEFFEKGTGIINQKCF
ncbi:unnamed protein product [Blepharisma stoltei]|uniref:Actin, cytoplasmic n=1 Tax=Blepharisma stoltei TaxID=1481888 RepID=A0AAU9K899_9CILI|nr:unnamed protein product [Blepharisma stoltei]